MPRLKNVKMSPFTLTIIFISDASERFRMFVTDYNEGTIRSFDSDGNEKATYNIPRAGTGLTVIPFDNTNADPNPKLVYSDVEEIVMKNGFESKQLHNVTSGKSISLFIQQTFIF